MVAALHLAQSSVLECICFSCAYPSGLYLIIGQLRVGLLEEDLYIFSIYLDYRCILKCHQYKQYRKHLGRGVGYYLQSTKINLGRLQG